MRAQKKEQNAKMEADGCAAAGIGGLGGIGPTKKAKGYLEVRGIDPRTSRMLSERSTI